MINLLSTDRKSELRAARVNVFLLRYMTIIVMAIVFLIGVLYVSYTVLQQTESTANARIASNDVKAGVYSATKAEVEALRSQLGEAKNQLDNETSYATILTTLGSLMPEGTIIEALKLDSTILTNNTPVELIAYAKTEENAAAIQQQLQSSPIFTQVALQATDAAAGTPDYPVKVTLSVTFNGKGL